MKIINENLWIDDTCDPIKIHTHEKPIEIMIGFLPYIEIQKLYGPTSSEPIRVLIEDYHWVIQRFNCTTEVWEEKIRWFIQESYKETDENNSNI